MKDRLIAFLSDLKKRKAIFAYSEGETKQAIISPLLSLIAWNPFDPEEVTQEYAVEQRRVDYALRVFSAPKVFIEVKKVDEPLAPHEEQLVSYATRESVMLAVLTNGITWWLYLPLVEGKWDQKKFYTIDVMEQEPPQAAEKFIEFLSKSMTASGEAITRAEAVFKDRRKHLIISAQLPKAWNRLVETADETLVQLLKENTEKLCGYELETETVIRFIEQHQDAFTIDDIIKPVTGPASSRKPVGERLSTESGRAKETRLRVTINWQKVGKPQPVEVLGNDRGLRIFLHALERIAKEVGMPKFRGLLNFQVNRGMLLSGERTRYHRSELLGFYVLTHNGTEEKARILTDVAGEFGLPLGFLEVEVVE